LCNIVDAGDAAGLRWRMAQGLIRPTKTFLAVPPKEEVGIQQQVHSVSAPNI